MNICDYLKLFGSTARWADQVPFLVKVATTKSVNTLWQEWWVECENEGSACYKLAIAS